MIMSTVGALLQEIQNLDAEFDDADNLDKFFTLLKRFNDDQDYEPEFREAIEAHFNYKW